MKKFIMSVITFTMIGLSPVKSRSYNVANDAIAFADHNPGDTTGVYLLKGRLEEIKAMDKSHLSFAEKRALRKEVKDINKQLEAKGFLFTIALLGIIAILLMILLRPF